MRCLQHPSRRALLLFGLAGWLPEVARAEPLPWAVNDRQWPWLRQLKGIATRPGMTAPALYVFFDPDCPWCQTLWNARLPDGRWFREVPAVWIPVAYLQPDSLGKAAALLRAGDVAALQRNFGPGYVAATRSGAIAPVSPSAAERKALGQSQGVWQNLGGATPMLVWRAKDGRVLRDLGMPKDLAELQRIAQSVAPSHLQVYRP